MNDGLEKIKKKERDSNADFLIASEPFPVSRSSLLTEISKPRPPNCTNTMPVAAVTSSSAQAPMGGQAEKENLPDDEAASKDNCFFMTGWELCAYV